MAPRKVVKCKKRHMFPLCVIFGKNVMNTEILEVSLFGIKTVHRLERGT